MKLYRSKIPDIAHTVIETLVAEGAIEVNAENKAEAEKDSAAIMEEFLRRDNALRDRVREYMAERNVAYELYGKTRGQMAEEWGHPTGDEVPRFFARQIVENFMISHFVEEVYADDKDIYKRVIDLVRKHDVDERAIRDEAKDKIKNVAEGTVDYEIALSKAIREVKKRYGLIA